MGETLRSGNSDDSRVHDPGGSGFCSRGEIDEGAEGGIESFQAKGGKRNTRPAIWVLISVLRGSIFSSKKKGGQIFFERRRR